MQVLFVSRRSGSFEICRNAPFRNLNLDLYYRIICRLFTDLAKDVPITVVYLKRKYGEIEGASGFFAVDCFLTLTLLYLHR